MTTSVWNKSEIGKQFEGCATLSDVIARLEHDFSGRGEVICEIRINGMLLKDDDESKFAGSRLEEISDLAIASENPHSLVGEALQSAREYLPRVREACVRTADAFRGQDQHEAQVKFAEAAEGCQWFVDTIHSIRGACDGISVPLADRGAWQKAEVNLARVVNEVLVAYQKKDFVLIADLLEYELHNVLDEWEAVLLAEGRP